MANKKTFTIPAIFISLIVSVVSFVPMFLQSQWDTATCTSVGVIILSSVLASVFAKLYINLFVESGIIATVGGLIFACSCSAFEIMKGAKIGGFVFLPLCLYFLEKLMADNKKGLFALAFALSLVSFASAGAYLLVFLVLYIILRWATSDWQVSKGKIASLVAELFLGAGLSFAILQPVFENIVAKQLPDYLLFHTDGSKYFTLVTSLFIPLSITAYLPLFTLVGVLAFLFTKREHWLKGIIPLFVIVAFVPFLKNLLTNNNYSAIYISLPLLMGALATSIAVERPDEHKITKGWFVSFIITGASLYGYYKYLNISFDNIEMHIQNGGFVFLLIVVLSFISLAFCAGLLIGTKPTTAYKVSLLCATALFCAISIVFMNLLGQGSIAKIELDNVVLTNISLLGIIVSGVFALALILYVVLSCIKAKREKALTAFGAIPFESEEGEKSEEDLESYLQNIEVEAE